MPAMLSHYERLFSGIKVLHLISSGGLFGAERVVLNLAAKSEGITSFVGALNNQHNPHLEIIEEAKNLGLNTVVFDSHGKFDLGTVNAVKKFIVENKIDLMHTHNYKSDIIGFAATRLTKTKWIATHHGWIGTDKKLKVYEKIDSFILKQAKKIVLVSSKMKRFFLQMNIKENRLELIDNGIPLEKFNHQIRNEQMRSLWGARPEDCAIMIVGRLSKEKGHEIFLKAAAEVLKNIQNVKFIIVGEGTLCEELKQQTHDLNLADHVFFTGFLEDIPAAYAAADIIVNASSAEGLPLTILEAMASRLPVIATDVGAVGEVIKDHKNGILLEPGDDHQLALRMIELAQSKEKRHRFAENAFQDVCSRFSDTSMAIKYSQVYAEVLQENKDLW